MSSHQHLSSTVERNNSVYQDIIQTTTTTIMEVREEDIEQDVDQDDFVFNQTLYDEKILVQNWRFALEGVVIPCIGIPGIAGK